MCGIVGYAGHEQAAPFLLEGLEKLEYRGYDSAGIAVFSDKVRTVKSQGRLAVLREKVNAAYPARSASDTLAGQRTAHRTTSTLTRIRA